MNTQKLTQKSMEAIQSARSLSVTYGNPQLEEEHLLLALLRQEDGLIGELIGSLGVRVSDLDAALESGIRIIVLSAVLCVRADKAHP